MDFMEIARYNANGNSNSQATLPAHWRMYRHPNGDVYYYNSEFRLITPEDISDSDMLENVLEAREDHLNCLEGDPNIGTLPPDYELVIRDVSDETATIRMYSRTSTKAYTWTEDRGLVINSREQYWSHVAEFPSHHATLPPGTENEFARALDNAKGSLLNGAVFPFTENQIDQIIARYQDLLSLRSQGYATNPQIAWLMGAIMPLDAVGRRLDDQDLAAMMNGLHT